MSHGALSSYNKVGTSYYDGKEMCKKRDARAKLLLNLLLFLRQQREFPDINGS